MKLRPHPAFPASSVRSIDVELSANDREDVRIDFRIEGEGFIIPARRPSERTDELWKSTCFELFLREQGSEAYCEFNFSHSTQWAAYAFDGYRDGMRELEMPIDPHIEFEPTRPLDLRVDLDLSKWSDVPMLAGISAVIEERNGTRSYWALAHPAGNRPDFHHPDCFVVEFPAARAA